MFDYLTKKFSNLIENFTAKKLNVENLKPFFDEVENGLYDADVPFEVVEKFLESVKEDVSGKKYPKELSAQQALVKILNQRLIELLSSDSHEIEIKKPPIKVMMVGLQGTGKTTSAAKLAAFFKKKKKSVLLTSLDVYRPAAREQLKVLSQKVDCDFFDLDASTSPQEILIAAMKKAKFFDVFIVDTAGRLQTDKAMMDEVQLVSQTLKPQETLYTLDAMAGQESLNVAKEFSEHLPLTGVVTTKMDSDTRAGAILGLKSILGLPVKFVSSGEDVLAPHTFSQFHPDRVAQRILGMGDMLSLIESIEQNIDQNKAKKWQQEILSNKEINFEQLQEQLEQMNSLVSGGGGLQSMLKHLPGMSQLADNIDNTQVDKTMKHTLALISSMTVKERRYPALMQQGSRKKRVVAGAGLDIQALNRLLKQRVQMSKMMKKMSGKKGQGMLSSLKKQLPGSFLGQ